jgi:hypothetical protein
MIGVDKAQALGLGLDIVRRIKAAVSALMMQADFSQARSCGAQNCALAACRPRELDQERPLDARAPKNRRY